MLVIRKIAREYKGKQYHPLMSVIANALEPGEERLSPAFLTVTRVIDFLHSSLLDRLSPIEFYEEMLKEIKKQEGEK